MEQYKENLHKFFSQIKALVGRDCLMLWAPAMPLAKKIKGGFLVPELDPLQTLIFDYISKALDKSIAPDPLLAIFGSVVVNCSLLNMRGMPCTSVNCWPYPTAAEVSHLAPSLCYDIIEANFYSSQLADAYGLDVLDLHFHFRFSLQHRMPDGIHWDALAHRRISSLLLGHAADAWGGYREDFGQNLRPDWPSPRALMDSGPLQRYGSLRYQQSHSSDRFQHVEQSPSEPCSIMHRRLVTTSKVITASEVPLPRHIIPSNCSRGAAQWPSDQTVVELSILDVTQLLLESAALPLYFLCSIMLILAEVFLLLDATVSVDYNPLPPANPWLSQRVHPQARAPWSQDDSMLSAGGGLKSLPPARQDDHCMRRRRPNFRSHPYPPILPRVTPRHPTHGCVAEDRRKGGGGGTDKAPVKEPALVQGPLLYQLNTVRQLIIRSPAAGGHRCEQGSGPRESQPTDSGAQRLQSKNTSQLNSPPPPSASSQLDLLPPDIHLCLCVGVQTHPQLQPINVRLTLQAAIGHGACYRNAGPEMDLRCDAVESLQLRRVSTALSLGPYVWVLGPRWELSARSTSDWTV
ncbi:hypothetical protein F7725_004242 [Dissostichus mawsoni]|uniref:Uncharacterized protein n=1 Tax=Dissostichus mawsoni TaxID=36200 RepID=A0A7J5XKR6_DISMA|nr:hypothetical protein F7725_004242 [Dissostichus mawsoni]